mgnify:CR=1 FL=1
MAIRFNASDLREADLAGVTVRRGSFSASALRGSDFTGVDFSGARMDKLTYAMLKSYGADLAGVTVE